jgi:hypothetical protein
LQITASLKTVSLRMYVRVMCQANIRPNEG